MYWGPVTQATHHHLVFFFGFAKQQATKKKKKNKLVFFANCLQKTTPIPTLPEKVIEYVVRSKTIY